MACYSEIAWKCNPPNPDYNWIYIAILLLYTTSTSTTTRCAGCMSGLSTPV